MKRILMIGNINSIFLYEYVTEVLDCSNNEVHILTFCEENAVNIAWREELKKERVTVYYNSPNLIHIGKINALKNLLRYRIVADYDVIHIFGVSKISFATVFFARPSQKVIVSYYGSDLLQAEKKERFGQKALLRRASTITFATEYMVDQFISTYQGKYTEKVKTVKYGTKNAETMQQLISRLDKNSCKNEFMIPIDKVCIFCGYNGNRSQKHIDIINELIKLPDEIRAKLFLMFHCSYGLDEQYKKELEQVLSQSSISGQVNTDFMIGEELAKFRHCADIMLNLQPTDALSASMLECLEARAVVIKGDWLQYPDLKNVYMVSISKMQDLAEMVEKIVEDYQYYYGKTSVNPGVLYRLLSWNNCKDEWRSLLI